MLRTLGVPLPTRGPRRAGLTTAFTLFVTVGFVVILLAVAAGWLRASGQAMRNVGARAAFAVARGG